MVRITVGDGSAMRAQAAALGVYLARTGGVPERMVAWVLPRLDEFPRRVVREFERRRANEKQ